MILMTSLHGRADIFDGTWAKKVEITGYASGATVMWSETASLVMAIKQLQLENEDTRLLTNPQRSCGHRLVLLIT